MDPITAIANAITAGLTTFNNVWGAMNDDQKKRFVDLTLTNQAFWTNLVNPDAWKNIFTHGKNT